MPEDRVQKRKFFFFEILAQVRRSLALPFLFLISLVGEAAYHVRLTLVVRVTFRRDIEDRKRLAAYGGSTIPDLIADGRRSIFGC